MLWTSKLSVAAILLAAVPVMADEARQGGTSEGLERASRVETTDVQRIEAQPLVYRGAPSATVSRQTDPQVSRGVVLASSRGEKPNPPIVNMDRAYTNADSRAGAKLANYEQLQVVGSRPIDAASPTPVPVNTQELRIDAASPRPQPVIYRSQNATPASFSVGVGVRDRGRGSRTSVGFSYSSGYSNYYDRGYYGYSSYGYAPYCAPVYCAPVYCPPPVVYYRPAYYAPYRSYCGPGYYRSSFCGPRIGLSFSFHGRF